MPCLYFGRFTGSLVGLHARAKVDPKVSADQRGHGIGVSLDVYTKKDLTNELLNARIV
jgi:hypothetical protein